MFCLCSLMECNYSLSPGVCSLPEEKFKSLKVQTSLPEVRQNKNDDNSSGDNKNASLDLQPISDSINEEHDHEG